MPIPTYSAKCLSHAMIAKNIYEFRLEKPQGFTFQAGQFVMFSVPLLTNPSDVQSRAFSVASSPKEPDLLFVAKIKEGGRAGTWISQALKAGDTVTFQGPLGAFFLDRTSKKNFLFMATGSGVAPLRSQIMTALAEGETRRMDLVYGAWNEEELFWTGQYEAITKEHPNFNSYPILSNPSASWKGLKGYVQDAVPTIIGGDCTNTSFYLCGNPVMIKAVKELCCGAWCVENADIHADEYV